MEEAEACKEHGATLFQGYAFSWPEGLEARPLSPLTTARLDLIRPITDPSNELTELEGIVLGSRLDNDELVVLPGLRRERKA